ncbi:cell growth regulator with RING finger domain protein 1-like isoform X2 [Acanthaster planci]|uniref:Cell growth regulator with RING finger domain protein 1-like isoform X2 n=1 Tax=Acanthaster planci TaxID=133434 RepID=A0A8B7YKL8_ACAPL|nr:cell growth regulator with RING finger domain protein 1-like isoform X2 [Acanthaster planci]
MVLSSRMNINSPFTQPLAPIVPELPIVGARNPFAIKVLNPDSASLRDGVQVLVKSLVDSELHALWAVGCSSLQTALQDGGLRLLCDAGQRLQSDFLYHSHPVIFSSGTETEVSLLLPDSVTDTQILASMGPPPRHKYPLCLIVRSLLEDSWMDMQPQVVGAVYVLHLPDETFSDECRLISQLIISSSGQVCDLQKLFMATDGNETSQHLREPAGSSCNVDGALPHRVNTDEERLNAGIGEMSSVRNGEDSVDANDALHGCVVCQNGLISIALLPCRHTCICSFCLPLLNKCPMCRHHIESFFPLNQGIDGECNRAHFIEEEPQDGDDWVTKFNNLCERFNRWLGLDY